MKKFINTLAKKDFPINGERENPKYPKFALTDELMDKRTPWWKWGKNLTDEDE